jgi:hypothetical protein
MYTVPFVERIITSVIRTVPPAGRTRVICTVPPVERISVLVRTSTLVIGTVPLLRGHLRVCKYESQVPGSRGGRPAATASAGVFRSQRGDLKLQQ